jgi:16S rRNA (cytosine1402-N4)-methyltransferase
MEILHVPVLKNEILSYLAPDNNGQMLIDGTLGEGGHSLIFLERYPELKVIGIDADKNILAKAAERLKEYAGRIEIINMWFDDYFQTVKPKIRPDRILFDLGISVFHFVESSRGFSFAKDEPLDMRINPEESVSAHNLVNDSNAEELADIFYQFGEERYSRRIASAVVRNRASSPIATTGQLAEIIRRAVPRQYRYGRIHPATRCFQALRIGVNHELDRIKRVLPFAFEILAPGGRLGVISFHSLEDRIVKHFFKEKIKSCTCPPETPMCKCGGEKRAFILTKKPVQPGTEEIAANPPSRSAKLRVIQKMLEEENS